MSRFIALRLMTVATLVVTIFTQGCENTSFSGGNDRGKRSRRPLGDGIDGADGGNASRIGQSGADGSSSGRGADPFNNGSGVDPRQGVDGADGAIDGPFGSPDEVFGGDGSQDIPRNCVNQNLLILDFKSGWWEVSGAAQTAAFRDVALDELRSRSCTGSNPIVEYHHILKDKKPAKFYDKDFKVYTQVWILSGTVGDRGDLDVGDAGLLDVIEQIKTFKPRVFIGAGFGSIDHGNAVTRGLFGADFFRGDFVSDHSVVTDATGSNATVKSTLSSTPAGSLFTGLTGPLADHVQVGFVDYTAADEIIAGLPGVTILAQCQSNPYPKGMIFGGSPQPTRSIPCIAVGKAAGLEFVLDSGLGRFYTLPTQAPTKAYFRNILRALSI